MKSAPAGKGRSARFDDRGSDANLSKTAKPTKARISVLLPDGSTFQLRGKAAQIMRVLAAGAGITSLDVWRITTRLSSFVHHFRHRYGVCIISNREPHEGGWHSRYRLGEGVIIDSG